MYDVTSETSLLNARNWLVSVHDGVDDGTVLLLFGNKADVVDEGGEKLVKSEDAQKLAEVKLCHVTETEMRPFDEISINNCHYDNPLCSQWWKFHQNDISIAKFS